ncbi:MAG: sulfurtransferase TusA family protein [Magnetococcales bacterium]|nr:sulfurtransferase TusA family protein [Magnetococcales bacterium]
MADATIDITRETCPLTFIKVELQLAAMMPGQTLLVRLRGEEPRRNLPDILREEGFIVSEPRAIEGELYHMEVCKPQL